jgi:hypothetical protein
MIRKQRSGFKMKRSPAKNLGDFFGSIFSGKAVKENATLVNMKV